MVMSHMGSMFSGFSQSVFSGFLLGFLIFLYELDQIILFSGGSSHSVHGNGFDLFLVGHGEFIY